MLNGLKCGVAVYEAVTPVFKLLNKKEYIMKVKILKEKVDTINVELEGSGSMYRVQYECRNNYHAIDLYFATSRECKENLTTGPVKKVYEYLVGFHKAMLLFQW